jgi:hypothetical protein
MKIKLSENYWIEDETHGYSIVTMVPVSEKKGRGSSPPKLDEDGNVVMKEQKAFYGTVYQALQGYLQIAASENTESLEGLAARIKSVMIDIHEAATEIKDHFCIEVRHTGGAPTRQDILFPKVVKFLTGPAVGASSRAICKAAIYGVKDNQDYFHPSDLSDFARCVICLKEIGIGIDVMAGASRQWDSLISNWDILLESLIDEAGPDWLDSCAETPKSYALMREIVNASVQ